MSKKIARYPVHKTADRERRSSVASFSQPSASLQAYLSPILLANLQSPSYIRITPLAPHLPSLLPRGSALQKPRITSSSVPPSAKEVTLLKISTPLSSDRLLQPSLFAALKEHFEQKRRVVRSGDLIGVSIDESLGRAVFQTAAEDEAGNDELLSTSRKSATENGASPDGQAPKIVAWFKIGNVSSSSQAPRDGEEGDVWGGAVTVDAASTKMEMNGSEQGKTLSGCEEGSCRERSEDNGHGRASKTLRIIITQASARAHVCRYQSESHSLGTATDRSSDYVDSARHWKSHSGDQSL
jgi:peroxin-6